MTRFPSEWFHFTDHKEIRRLRQAVSETTSFKIEITVAVILAIASAFFDDVVSQWCLWIKIVVFLVVCLGVILLFNHQTIKRLFSDSVLLGVKRAVTIFDEEVVYDIMVAAEFCKIIDALNMKEKKDQLDYHMIAFYNLEIKYYIQQAQEKLSRMRAESSVIFGKEHVQVDIDRIINAISMIDTIKTKSGIKIEDKNNHYQQFVHNISTIHSKLNKSN